MKTIEELGVSPAPWEACEDDAPKGYAIDLYGDGVCRCNQHEYAAPNLRLIAAAPDLYEALRKIVSNNECGLMCNLCAVTDRCEIYSGVKALEKAGGAE